MRPMTVFGDDDAPHGHAEMRFNGVEVEAEAIILGEGEGFTIAQGRLGPGRLHHCMRAVGVGHAALEATVQRIKSRRVFGATLASSSLVQAQIADAWLRLHMAWCAALTPPSGARMLRVRLRAAAALSCLPLTRRGTRVC